MHLNVTVWVIACEKRVSKRVVNLPVKQVKYFAGERLLVLTQWGGCKPIIVIQFAFALCGPRLVIITDCQFGTSIFGGDKLGIQCSIALIKASIVRQKNIYC